MSQLYVATVLESVEGIGPDGTLCEFRFPEDSLIAHAKSSGNSAVLQDAWFIPDVLAKPSSIWRGLMRNGHENFFVYAGIPDGRFAFDYGMILGEDITIPPGFVFLVFTTENFVVCKYRWVEPDPTFSDLPIDHQNRFMEKLWQPNSQNS